MIIRYPTALYKSVLPAIDGVGNVTFTISSNDPPRENIIPPPLQGSGSGHAIPPRDIDSETRREALGGLFSFVASGIAAGINEGMKAYEVGQLLDFSDESDNPPALSTALVPNAVELQQNTNLLDLAATGLTDDEINNLTVSARASLDTAISQFNEAQSNIRQLETQIQDNQRLLNELYKVETAVIVVLNDPVIIKKLTDRKQQLLAERDQLAIEHSKEVSTAQAKYSDILSIKEVVR